MVIAGARPNFMKVAPIIRALKEHKKSLTVTLVHTGQHYDACMSDIFFKDLKIAKPNIYLNVGSSSHAVQTATIMKAFEQVIIKKKPDLVLVVGDVNSTLACSLVASKLGVKVAHVEAGLRSFDRNMPEEINRLVTDAISDYLFISEESGLINLKNEGVATKKIIYVGNCMIDTLLFNMERIEKSKILKTYDLKTKTYAVLTLHRPSNVDSNDTLTEIYNILKAVSQKIKIIYPIHPRTKMMIKKHQFLSKFKALENLIMIDPLGYLDFNKLVKYSKLVLTDSGGIQEETTLMKVPCLTMRENTERPSTLKQGTNILVGRNRIKIMQEVNKILNNYSKKSEIPKYWDGKASQRIVNYLIKQL